MEQDTRNKGENSNFYPVQKFGSSKVLDIDTIELKM